jgi:hypothetical protein
VAAVNASELVREAPDTLLAGRFAGEPMVQSFRVAGRGRAWIPTADALAVPGFGRAWVAERLTELEAELGAAALAAALRRGLRLHAEAEAALPRAA